MGLLSLSIWLPVAFGALLLAVGRDQNAGVVRGVALVGAIASCLVTLPLITRFDTTGFPVTFAGSVSLAALVAYYRTATAFVSLSEHEGFGVPLLEAMRFDLPVIAYDAGAVAETLGDAGLRVKSRDLAEIAELVGLVAERPELRTSLGLAGQKRVAEFSTARVEKRTRDVLGL